MSDLEYAGRIAGGLLLLGSVGAVLFIGGAWLASLARAAWTETVVSLNRHAWRMALRALYTREEGMYRLMTCTLAFQVSGGDV